MSLNEETSSVLKYGTLIGLAVMVVGLVLSSFEFSDTLLAAGVLILIFAPFAGVLTSTKCLIQEKDRFWVKIALILVTVLIIGMIISYLV